MSGTNVRPYTITINESCKEDFDSRYKALIAKGFRPWKNFKHITGYYSQTFSKYIDINKEDKENFIYLDDYFFETVVPSTSEIDYTIINKFLDTKELASEEANFSRLANNTFAAIRR